MPTILELFGKYLDNDKFVDWIVNPTQENDAYWEDYILRNPNERKKIMLLREYLKTLETKNRKLSLEEKQNILDNIYNRIDFKGPDEKVKPMVPLFLKYAALFLILISSVIYLKLQLSQKSIKSNEVFEQVSVDSIKETRLILGNQNQIRIADKNSEIDYKDAKAPIINGKDTLEVAQKVGSGELVLNQVVVPYGKRSRLRLEDGSVVHLNSGSRFVFPRRFMESQREVYLDGEAFFEVQSDTERPFRVRVFKDDALAIEAVGTRFNVNAYGFHDEVYTVLTEGKVHLKDNSQNVFFGKKGKTVMRPGELALWNVKSRSVSKNTVNTELYTSWIKGIYSFKSEPLEGIAKQLEIYYNIEILFDTTIDQEFRITGKLDLNDDIQKTMENLALINSMAFKKIGAKKFLLTK